MTIAFAVMTLILAAMNLYLAKRIQSDIGRVEEQEEEIGAAFVGISDAAREIGELKTRMEKVEQIATNAQNKSIANQRRIEKAVIYDGTSGS